jgi:Kef-type K+ transport system membrane component KefB
VPGRPGAFFLPLGIDGGDSVHQSQDILFSTLLQLVVIILAARLANRLLRRIGQPGAVGEIIAGLLLGPSLLGHLFPGVSRFLFNPAAAMPMTVISQVGLILLMFQIGTDFEFSHLGQAHNRKAAVAVALASIAVPFCLGLTIGYVSAPILAPTIDIFTYSLFLGVALAITALPILGRILREYDLTRTELGVVAISAAALNDVTGWVLLAGTAAYASARFSPESSALQIGGILALAAGLWFVGRPAVDWLLRRLPVADGRIAPNLMAIAVALLLALGIATYLLGIFPIFGGFAAGLLFHRHRDFVEAWRNQVGQFVLVFFLPVFFTYTGLRTNVLGLVTLSDWTWCSILFVAAVIGKIVPVYSAARWSGFSRDRSAVMGVLMNTRALMELIVLNIGFELGFIPQRVFTMLVIMAVATTMMTAPLLRVLLPRTGHRIPFRIEA